MLCIASFQDLKIRKISNAITFPCALLGIVYGASHGIGGLGHSLAGIGIGLGILLLPYMAGLMAAGDVKLFSAVGAWLGVAGTVEAFLWTSIIGAGMTLAYFLFRLDLLRKFGQGVWETTLIFAGTRRFSYVPLARRAQGKFIPYGVAIAAGTIVSRHWGGSLMDVFF